MQDYGFPQPKSKKTNYLRWFLAVFLILLFLGFLKRNLGSQNQQIVSPLPEEIFSLFSQKPKDPTSLLSEIKKIIDKFPGSWSVYFYDLTTNQGFGINETAIFTAASVNKVPILASLYYLAGRNAIDLDQQVTLQVSDIQDYGTGSIRYDPPGTTYSLKTLARLMMEKSDNTAAHLLGRQIIGFEKIQKLVDTWGLTQTDMEENKTSLVDMNKLFLKMYRGEITNQALTSEMIGFMDDSDFEDRIPALLPKGVKVYHKTGDETGNIHDVGIVELPNHPYFIGILTSDVSDEAQTKQTIAQISKMVFEYMKH
jgi:beta-lactamase class A